MYMYHACYVENLQQVVSHLDNFYSILMMNTHDSIIPMDIHFILEWAICLVLCELISLSFL